MKVSLVSALSLAGMVLTSAAVYSLTPAANAVDPTSEPPKEPSTALTSPTSTNDNGPKFVVNETLAVEGALGHATLLTSKTTETFVLLEVRGASTQQATTRAPVNLALVIDRSGSMRSQRLENAMQAAQAATGRLQDDDVVSVLSFDTKTQVVVPPTVMDPSSRRQVVSGIRSIVLGGDTCISCGIEDGISLLAQTEGKVNRMILLSDGDATAGVRDIPGFRTLAQRARDKGIAVTTVGVNVDYNEQILGAVAEESNGEHYFVEDDAALARAFEQETEALKKTIASAAEIAIELGQNVELDRVYDRSFRRADRRVLVPLGAFSQGDIKTVLLKVRVTPKPSSQPTDPIASVELNYRDLISGNSSKLVGKLESKQTDNLSEASTLDPVVQARLERSETATALVEANRLVLQGKLDEARKRLNQQSSHLRTTAETAKKEFAGRTGDIDNAYKGQTAALDRALSRFENAQPLPDSPYQSTTEGKSTIRDNNKSSFDLRK